jgi:hypothetical protein
VDVSEEPGGNFVELFRVVPETGEETWAGSAEYGTDGILTLTQALPELEAKLQSALQSVNAKARIVELVAPAGSGERFATGARVTERTDEGFMRALDRHLRTYHSFGLG